MYEIQRLEYNHTFQRLNTTPYTAMGVPRAILLEREKGRQRITICSEIGTVDICKPGHLGEVPKAPLFGKVPRFASGREITCITHFQSGSLFRLDIMLHWNFLSGVLNSIYDLIEQVLRLHKGEGTGFFLRFQRQSAVYRHQQPLKVYFHHLQKHLQ